ncbi:hypothetical protein DFQ28_003311 [Apophysomyces sp. BC1034]|nr:hypothetical protein DFQ30_007758 [Apophysomyces sp. BC1015]KAG0189533.1 hypothetical protein DFQ28_003311 [Apophysomyces sp. BC1034]
MNTVLPAHAIRIKQPSLLVLAPSTVELQQHLLTIHNDKSKTNDPSYGFLSENHISYICSHHMGHFKPRAAAKPFWDMGFPVNNDHPVKPIPAGLSRIMEVYVRQFATACRNMWAGAMIPYVIQRLTLLLLRFSLAPEREKNTYSTRKRNQEARNKDKK